MQKKLVKTIASILIVILLYGYSGVTISYAVDALMTEAELESQTTDNDKNVDFDVFYEDGKHSRKISINNSAQEIKIEQNAVNKEKSLANNNQDNNDKQEENNKQNTAQEKDKEEINNSESQPSNQDTTKENINSEEQKNSAEESQTAEETTNKQESETNSENQKIDGNANNQEINTSKEEENNVSVEEQQKTEYIHVKLYLKNIGYIEDGTIDFSNCNFKVIDDKKQDIIKDIENNMVVLNRCIGGEEIEIVLAIEPNKNEKVAKDFFNKDNLISFKGTFINEKGAESKVENSIVIHTEWNIKEADAKIEQTITKYVPFKIDNSAGILLQTKIQSGIIEAVAPIKTTRIEILAPKIADMLPEKLNIVAKSTAATNGDINGTTFSRR